MRVVQVCKVKQSSERRFCPCVAVDCADPPDTDDAACIRLVTQRP